MGVYKYKATKSTTGGTIESIIYADSAEEAFEKIMEMGYAPEKIEEINAPDRRVNERLEIGLKIIYSRFKPGQEPRKTREGSTSNLSSGGLLFKAEQSYDKGTILDLELELPEGIENIKCLARVIRCDKIGQEERQYNVAACFLDLPNSERSRINDYINQQKR
ncbi:MAG: PilZ domain-containing protein [Candidatus Omnitrophota bacterium]